jgi:DNA primase
LIGIVPPYSTKQLLEKATEEYQNQLRASPGLSHLLVRGFTEDTIQKFRLGYVEAPLSGDEKYVGRISIPYQTVSGVVALRYRTVIDERPKYLSMDGFKTRPFNVAALGLSSTVYITEGEMDAITLDQMGLCAIGIPGAQSWQSAYRRFLRFTRVILICDGDEAGRNLADRVTQDVPHLKVINMADGEDVNSIYVALGEQRLKELITTYG